MKKDHLTVSLPLYFLFLLLLSCNRNADVKLTEAEQWSTFEIDLASEKSYSDAYTLIDSWAVFKNEKGDSLVRPTFWDGGNNWKIRFAPPDSSVVWNWKTFASVDDKGLAGQTGSFRTVSYSGGNELLKHGLLKISPGKRNVVHDDGKPFLVVGDTPWSIPYRATVSQVKEYAKNRRQKGFNTTLLISMQPDIFAEGPEARNRVLGFDRAFEDSKDGHMNKLKPDYFQTLDTLVGILIDHELLPVFAPLAHGYGWKDKTALGSQADSGEYARYCRYLVARYGSTPALWLISVDNNGLSPGVKPAGETIEKWDCYRQPVGLHYNQWDNFLAKWAKPGDPCCFHYNRTYQDEPWLDFQWAQTGHDGKHIYHKVEGMYDNQPVKANMNGEPTYEGMGGGRHALGWWQGEDAWSQLMHGGTMGVIYGAVSLWQWKITKDEQEWEEWTDAPYSWRDALDFEGGKYVGFISRAFEGFDFADMEKRPDLTDGNKFLLAKEGIFYISYLENGGEIRIKNVPEGLSCRWLNPVNGEFGNEEKAKQDGVFVAPGDKPWVLIIGEKKW